MNDGKEAAKLPACGNEDGCTDVFIDILGMATLPVCSSTSYLVPSICTYTLLSAERFSSTSHLLTFTAALS